MQNVPAQGIRVGEVSVNLTRLLDVAAGQPVASGKNSLMVFHPLLPDQLSLYGMDEAWFWEVSSY